MLDGKYVRMPTGVADFDSILNGGLPAGSVVLLLGDVGAGQLEFCLTSAAKIGLVLENPKTLEFFLGHAAKHSKLPEKLSYITFSKSKQDVLQEVALAFNRDYYDSLTKRLNFQDFSEKYFMRTIVPPHWVQETKSRGLFARGSGEKTLLEDFVAFFDENSTNSIIIVDSLTDLIVNESVPFPDLIAVLKGLKRMAKNWKCLIYLILTDDILDKRKQQMIIDSVDGVLRFEWSKTIHSSNRQRYMYVEKFMPVLSAMEQERIMRFATLVTSQSGFVVIDTERVA